MSKVKKCFIVSGIILVMVGAGLFIRQKTFSEPEPVLPEAVSPVISPTPTPSPTPVPVLTIGGIMIPADTEAVTFSPETTFSELEEVLPQLALCTAADASECDLSVDEMHRLKERFPDISFCFSVPVGDSVLRSDAACISVASPEETELYLTVADLFDHVSVLELEGGSYDPETASSLCAALRCPAVSGTLRLFGQEFSTDAEELDFSGTRIKPDETGIFDDVIRVMPSLKKVIMSDCGIGNEDMEALNMKYDSVQFVWTVYFQVYSLRTDTTYFCVSDLGWNDYVCWPMTEKDFAPLRYCHDLEALDLGHENISDLSFLYEMPKLRYLIIISCHNKIDLTPIASLKDLVYLEVFHNEIDDFSPLLECKNLRHLNIGYCTGAFSIEPLMQMTQLERLWFPGNHLTEEESAALVAALPDTRLCLKDTDNQGSTGCGWRKDEMYYEMRDAMHMFY